MDRRKWVLPRVAYNNQYQPKKKKNQKEKLCVFLAKCRKGGMRILRIFYINYQHFPIVCLGFYSWRFGMCLITNFLASKAWRMLLSLPFVSLKRYLATLSKYFYKGIVNKMPEECHGVLNTKSCFHKAPVTDNRNSINYNLLSEK